MRNKEKPYRHPGEFVEEIPGRLQKENRETTQAEHIVSLLEQEDGRGTLESFLKEHMQAVKKQRKNRLGEQGIFLVAMFLRKKIDREDRKEYIPLFDEVVEVYKQESGRNFDFNIEQDQT